MSERNPQKAILPNNGKLRTNKETGEITAQLLDADWAVINCTFTGADSVIIDPQEFDNTALSIENLETLIHLIHKAQKI